MKTEEEIREMLNTYKYLKEQAPIFTSEFTLACGAITALETILEEN